MTKTKRIKQLKAAISTGLLSIIDTKYCEKGIAKLEKQLKAEEQRIHIFLMKCSENSLKRKEAYENRKLIKAGERESYRQRKIRLNKERRDSLNKY